MKYVPVTKIEEIINRFPRANHDLEASGYERGLNVLIEGWDIRAVRLFKEELLKQISLEALELKENESLGDFGSGRLYVCPCSQEGE